MDIEFLLSDQADVHHCAELSNRKIHFQVNFFFTILLFGEIHILILLKIDLQYQHTHLIDTDVLLVQNFNVSSSYWRSTNLSISISSIVIYSSLCSSWPVIAISLRSWIICRSQHFRNPTTTNPNPTKIKKGATIGGIILKI